MRAFFINLIFTQMEHTLKTDENTSIKLETKGREVVISIDTLCVEASANLDRQQLYELIGQLLHLQSVIQRGGQV